VGHVKLFSPFGMNATPLGRKAILAADGDHTFPADDACISGREHVERYLTPLAEVLDEHIKTETRVINVARVGLFKQDAVGDPARGKQPFLLLVRERNQDRFEEADVVLDCTGTYSHHRWLGPSGIPALGESQAEPHIAYQLVDVLGDAKRDYLNKSVLVVGSGYSAATTACNLASWPRSTTLPGSPGSRGKHKRPAAPHPGDPLRERDRLAVDANNLATRSDANVEFRANTYVESIEPQFNNQNFRVTLRTAGTRKRSTSRRSSPTSATPGPGDLSRVASP